MDKRGKQAGVVRSYHSTKRKLNGSVTLPPEVLASLDKNKKNQEGKPLGINNLEDRSSNQVPSADMSYRISMGTWHPKENTFAVARYNSMFLYTEKRGQSYGSSSDKK